MQTDIMLTHKGKDKKLIIDTKYYGKIMSEHHGKHMIPPNNLFQIFSYVKNMDKDNTGNVSGLLLYAKTEEKIFPDGKPFMVTGNSIGAKVIDLYQDFKHISKQLDDIVDMYFQ